MKKLIQLIDKFDGPQSTLSNEEFFIREKLFALLKIILGIFHCSLCFIRNHSQYFLFFLFLLLCHYFMDHYESVRDVAIFLLEK